MAHTVVFNPASGLIETEAHGELGAEEAGEIVAEILRLAMEKDCFLCLSDYRSARLVLSTVEIHAIPGLISESSATAGLQPERFKRAVVVAADLTDFRFLETVSSNRGQNVRLFTDLRAAKEWLSGK